MEKADSTWEQEEKGNKKDRMHRNEKNLRGKSRCKGLKGVFVRFVFSKDRNISCKNKEEEGSGKFWKIKSCLLSSVRWKHFLLLISVEKHKSSQS